MKQSFLNHAERKIINIKKEKHVFLLKLQSVMKKTDYSSEQVQSVKQLYYNFYVSVLDRSLTRYEQVEILHDVLLDVMKIIMNSNFSCETKFRFMDETDVISSLTFLLDQIRENRLCEKRIAELIRQAENTEYYFIMILLLYRVNRSFVNKNYFIPVSNMNSKELYYAITSGYVEYEEEKSISYYHLVHLCMECVRKKDCFEKNYNNPIFTVRHLHKEGFIKNPDIILGLIGFDGLNRCN